MPTEPPATRRLRCCGRFCYWKLPIGPWQCTKCDRLYDGPMPRSAGDRLIAEALTTRPLTEEELRWAEEIASSTDPLGVALRRFDGE